MVTHTGDEPRCASPFSLSPVCHSPLPKTPLNCAATSTDPSGLVVAGANITLQDSSRHTYAATSGPDGAYAVTISRPAIQRDRNRATTLAHRTARDRNSRRQQHSRSSTLHRHHQPEGHRAKRRRCRDHRSHCQRRRHHPQRRRSRRAFRRSRRSRCRPAGSRRTSPQGPAAAPSSSMASAAASFLPRNPSAKFASIQIPSPPNTTSSATAASRSSPSPAPINSTAPSATISAPTGGIPATPTPPRKSPFLLQETENSFSGPMTKRSSWTLDFERQAVDNGSVTNGVTLNSSFNPQPFSSVLDVNTASLARRPARRLSAQPEQHPLTPLPLDPRRYSQRRHRQLRSHFARLPRAGRLQHRAGHLHHHPRHHRE